MTSDDHRAFADKLAASKPPKLEALDFIDTLLNPELRDALLLVISGSDGADLDDKKRQLTEEMSEYLQRAGHTQEAANTLARYIIEAAARRSRLMGSQTGKA